VPLDASVLTRKYGPLPGYAWAGAAAIGAWFLLRGRQGTASTAKTGATATPGPDATYGLGFAQGLQSAGPGPPASTTSDTSRKYKARSKPWGFEPPDTANIPIYAQPNQQGGVLGYVPFGTQFTAGGDPVQGQRIDVGVAQSDYWIPYKGGYVSGVDAIIDAAQGGPARVGGPAAIGSRSSTLMAPHHPLVTEHHRYPHFVAAVGGAPNHTREVIRVAKQAGVHPARLMMLNPQPTGWIRVL